MGSLAIGRNPVLSAICLAVFAMLAAVYSLQATGSRHILLYALRYRDSVLVAKHAAAGRTPENWVYLYYR